MGETNRTILTVNAGSSSVKFDLFSAYPDNDQLMRIFGSSVTGIGLPNTRLTAHKPDDEAQSQQVAANDQATAISILIEQLTSTFPGTRISAIGNRIVHGGPKHSRPELITNELEQELNTFVSFDPEHAPASLLLMQTLREQLPDVPQVACFDTAFFHDLPRIAQILPLPRKYEAQGLRRYGFHGLSYTYLLSRFQAMAGDDAAKGRIIFAHLGSGVSLTATRAGKPIDTTMSFTPASGVVMSSRSGDLDPGVFSYLHKQTGMSVEDFTHMVNFESGLLGVSETSADMYTLIQNEATDSRAAEAVELFVYQVKKAIGALSTTLGGLDSLVFSGGIGEQSSIIRQRVCAGLGFLGVELDEARNEIHADLISADQSQVGVHVIPTDEARVIASQVAEVLSNEQIGKEV